MKDVKTIVITIEKELEEKTITNQLNGKVPTCRVIHMDGKELYRDELKADVADSDDIIRQLERFLEGRKFSGVPILPAGTSKWKLFAGMETAPYKEVSPVSINIDSVVKPILISTHSGSYRDERGNTITEKALEGYFCDIAKRAIRDINRNV